MKIIRTMTPQGLRSLLDLRYRGVRYRPVLGYNLNADQEHDAMITSSYGRRGQLYA